MRIYHRLSVVAEKKQHVYSLVHLLSLLESQKSEAGYSYDLVSVQPLNQETFDMYNKEVCRQRASTWNRV